MPIDERGNLWSGQGHQGRRLVLTLETSPFLTLRHHRIKSLAQFSQNCDEPEDPDMAGALDSNGLVRSMTGIR